MWGLFHKPLNFWIPSLNNQCYNGKYPAVFFFFVAPTGTTYLSSIGPDKKIPQGSWAWPLQRLASQLQRIEVAEAEMAKGRAHEEVNYMRSTLPKTNGWRAQNDGPWKR